MTTVSAFLKHSFISKGKQAQPYTAMAHARYIMRTEATQYVYSERMPKQWHAVQRFLEQHENGLRKNGRVMDKFIISIPHDVTEKDAIDTLRRFGNWLGQGRTPFLFTLQGFDTRNHHAHFIFIDKDVETGRRVFGTTEMNSTHGIKLEWQRVANSAFEEMGYDVRIAVKEGYAVEADNDNEETPTPLNNEAQLEDSASEADIPEDETDLSEDEMGDIQAIDPVATVRFMHDRVNDLEYLHRCKNRYTEAKDRHVWRLRERDKLSAEASDYEADSLPVLQAAAAAKERFEGMKKENGKLKGMEIAVLGYSLFKTKTRKLAEEAQVKAYEGDIETRQIEYTRKSYDRKLDEALQYAVAAEEEAYQHKAELERLFGSESEVEAAEELLWYQIHDAANMVPLEAAREAYENGKLTVDEYRTFLVEGGYRAEVMLLDEQSGVTEEGGASL